MELFNSDNIDAEEILSKIDDDFEKEDEKEGGDIPDEQIEWLKDPENDEGGDGVNQEMREKHFSDEDWLEYYKNKHLYMMEADEFDASDAAEFLEKYREKKEEIENEGDGESRTLFEALQSPSMDVGSGDRMQDVDKPTVVKTDRLRLPHIHEDEEPTWQGWEMSEFDCADIENEAVDPKGAAWLIERWYEFWKYHIAFLLYVVAATATEEVVRAQVTFMSRLEQMRFSTPFDTFATDYEQDDEGEVEIKTVPIGEMGRVSLEEGGNPVSMVDLLFDFMGVTGVKSFQETWDRLEGFAEGENEQFEDLSPKEVKYIMGTIKEFGWEVKLKMQALSGFFFDYITSDVEASKGQILCAILAMVFYSGHISPKGGYRRIKSDYEEGVFFHKTTDSRVGDLVQKQSSVLDRAYKMRGKHTD